jgi:hypothetical protein
VLPIYLSAGVSIYLPTYIYSSWGGRDWVRLVHRPLTGLLYQPRVIDDECGAVSGMRTGRGNGSTRRKPAPVPLCPSQIPYELTWAQNWPAAVGIQRLTAWAMERPPSMCINKLLQQFSDRTNALRLIMSVMNKYGALSVITNRTRIWQQNMAERDTYNSVGIPISTFV